MATKFVIGIENADRKFYTN